MAQRGISWLGAAFGAVLLAGCAETQLVSHTVKVIDPPKPTAKAEPQPPKQQGTYKVGKPYQIDGVWYYPAEDFEYDETGIASWYGQEFHGRPTANGEIFDMNEVSAAHRTLPMPSLVRVTNLDNGRVMLIRVNDRGPFARGRIIDLSRRAAQLLGMDRAGTAKVRVEIMAEESRQLAAIARRRPGSTDDGTTVAAVPTGKVTVQALPAPGATTGASAGGAAPAAPRDAVALEEPKFSQEVITVAVRPANIFVQAGAFANPANAQKLSSQLQGIGPAKVERAAVGKTVFYRVRVGPAATVEEADRMLERVAQAGFPEAKVVIE
jgi:rare lipoprotein A